MCRHDEYPPYEEVSPAPNPTPNSGLPWLDAALMGDYSMLRLALEDLDFSMREGVLDCKELEEVAGRLLVLSYHEHKRLGTGPDAHEMRHIHAAISIGNTGDETDGVCKLDVPDPDPEEWGEPPPWEDEMGYAKAIRIDEEIFRDEHPR